MKNWLLLALAATFLLGCNEEYRGKMTLGESLTLNKTSKKTVTFSEGEYRTKLEPTSKSRIKMTVRTGNDKKVKVYFKIPEGFEFPDLRGEFELASADSGQPVDLYGTLDTKVSQTEERRGYESCSYRVWDRVCRRYKGKDGRYYRRCRCESVTYNDGDREVQYYLRHTDRIMGVDIHPAGNSSPVGDFNGTDRSTQKIYTYQGICRERRWSRC